MFANKEQEQLPQMNEENGERRRRMHKRTVECDGYLRDDGLWEVEARLIDKTLCPARPLPRRDKAR
ncbi:DUF2889 domain-containing protein [Bradyrhizobium sediminis]|uniref:DUF2889 domain-containing protein n=1 Tax=Bradyrhizobium sediminis TaxID=2840469 RepID=A0A975P237_9BRAD|nr:DUF2889 domain-containing protein [Bradyrhizobium sediminis]QWG24986.1 DUF2889 domain-containing protein [Bradyrhizobium sediminis]